MIDIVFLVLPQTLLLDLAGPAEAFRLANQRRQALGLEPAYRLRFVGPQAAVDSSVGLALAGIEALPERLAPATRVVLLGQPSGHESPLQSPLHPTWAKARRWLAQVVAPAFDSGAELMTVCAGALLAADAGLLGQRRCTTHHEKLAELQRLAPAANVQANRIFVIDGPLATSAGVTAGVDLALHLIGRDCGESLAAAIAQTLVVYLRRGPDDPEHSPLLSGRNHLHAAVHRVQDAVCAQPASAWTLQSMAALAHVTPRHLARLFRHHVGRTPREYVEGLRAAFAERAISAGQASDSALAAAGIAGARQWRRIRSRRKSRAGTPAPTQGVPMNR